MSRSLASQILLALAIIFLIGTAYSMNRDYQDIWILQGLEIPFVFFVLTFVLAFYLEKSTFRRVTLAVIGRAVFMLIPAVKYTWFLGPWVDQNAQQAMANYVVMNGHVMNLPTVSQVYSNSPLEHLSFAILSLVLNIPVETAMKYLPIFWSMLFPILIYIIVKYIFPAESTLLAFALFISAIPIAITQYIVTGSLFGSLLVQFILTILVLIYVKTNRHFWPILVFSVIALSAAHSVSSFIFTGFLLILFVLKRFSRFGFSSFLSSTKVLTLVSIAFAWFLFQSYLTLQTLVQIITVEVPTGTTPISERIGTGSFAVLRIDPIAAISSFVVIYGADALFLLLSFGALLVMFGMRKKLNQISKFFMVFYLIIIILGVVGAILSAGGLRILIIAELLFPIFSGVFVFSILRKKARIRRLLIGLVFFMIISLATIQFYGYQPLVPSANVLYTDLPSDVKLVNLGIVNSIYQRQMINFASRYASGRVVAISPITTQIVGLTDANFSLTVLAYDPLDPNKTKPYYNYLLINMPGPAGDYAGNPNPSLNEPIRMSNYISNQTIIYTNGESYILANSP